MSRLSTTSFLNGHPHFTTRQFAQLTGRRIDAASSLLARLRRDGSIERVTRGVWAQPSHPHFQPLGAVPFILHNEQGYVSFLTALNLHGVLSQIPTSYQVATTGHGRRLASPIGQFELLRIQPSMMVSGIEMTEQPAPYPLAIAEKALLDVLYIATRRGRRYARLPELEIEDLDLRLFHALLEEQVMDGRIQTAVRRRFRRLLGEASAT